MKKLFTLVAALLLAATVWAQSSSPKMSYQAVIRNAANELVTSQTGITVEISIKEGDDVVYSETHTGVGTNQNGLVSLLIGEGTNPVGNLKDVDWTKAKISTSINLGGETVSATAPVTAVPYALYAESVNPNSEVINNIQGDITNIQGDITEIKENYLTKAGLCDSIKSCDAIQDLNDTLDFYYTKEEIKDTLNAYYDTTKINDTLKSYLTISGLCDSIKSCDAIKDLNDTLDFYYTKEEIKDTLNAYYDTTKINDTLKSYLTISGLCDSIKSCDAIKDLNDTLDFYYTKEEIKDTLANYYTQKEINDTLNNYYTKKEINDTLANYYTQKEINDTLNNYYTKKEINDTLKSYLTIDGLCDSIKNKCTDIATITTVQNAIHDSIVNKISAQISDSLKHITIPDITGMLTCDNVETECDKIAIKTAENIFSKKNTFSDTLDATDAGSAIIVNSVVNNGAIAATDSSRVVNAKDLVNYVNNAVASKQVTLTIASITADDSTKLMNDTTLTIPTGFDTLDLSHLVQLYINGVYVGDTDDQVLTVDATTKKVQYDPAKNGDYKLAVGDRIKILYWVKNN